MPPSKSSVLLALEQLHTDKVMQTSKTSVLAALERSAYGVFKTFGYVRPKVAHGTLHSNTPPVIQRLPRLRLKPSAQHTLNSDAVSSSSRSRSPRKQSSLAATEPQDSPESSTRLVENSFNDAAGASSRCQSVLASATNRQSTSALTKSKRWRNRQCLTTAAHAEVLASTQENANSRSSVDEAASRVDGKLEDDKVGPSIGTCPFTPEVIDPTCCLARTWNGALGGQCCAAPLRPANAADLGSGLCKSHFRQWKKSGHGLTHGRVDGPIPAEKLVEFEFHTKKMADIALVNTESLVAVVKDEPENQPSDKNVQRRSTWLSQPISAEEEQPLIDGWVPTRLPRKDFCEVQAQPLSLKDL